MNPAASDVWTAARGINLAGRRVLVVEDEVLVAATIECEVTSAGAEVVGPAYTVEEALALADEPVDAALLDINLNGVKVWEVAKRLHERGVPIIFASANVNGTHAIPSPFDTAPRFDKPVRMNAMLRALAEVTARDSRSAYA